MFNIQNKEHYFKVMEFASENGIANKLQEKIDYLIDFGNDKNNCYIGYDFAPNSFSFTITREDGSHLVSGGLIYNDNLKNWSVHT